MADPNSYFWWPVDSLGRWFWVPLPFYGALGLYYLYKLAAPETIMGRIIRVLLGGAFIMMAFSPLMNGLGPWAFHMMAIGGVLLVVQFYHQCLAAGKIINPTSETFIERMADRVSQPKETNVQAR